MLELQVYDPKSKRREKIILHTPESIGDFIRDIKKVYSINEYTFSL